METSGGKASRLTFDASQENAAPIWSADGSHIIFGSRRNGKWGIYSKFSNGTGPEELLYEDDLQKVPMSCAADGKIILYWVQDPKNNGDVWALQLDGDRKPKRILDTPFVEQHPQISPNGKWFAYTSNETGRSEIYVQSYPPGSGKFPISVNGGLFARWNRDGTELFFMDEISFGNIVSTRVEAAGSTFKFSTPTPLFKSAYLNVAPGHTGNWNTFDVSADGQRFLIPLPEASLTRLPDEHTHYRSSQLDRSVEEVVSDQSSLTFIASARIRSL